MLRKNRQKLRKLSFYNYDLTKPKLKKEVTIKSIVRYISQHKGKSGIIYTLNRKTTEELAEVLVANKIKAVAYHAGLDQKLRADRQDQFLNDELIVQLRKVNHQFL